MLNKTILFKIFVLCIAFSSNAQNIIDAQWKEINGVSVPIPPNEHPRLYLRAHNIPELKQRMQDPDLQPVLKKLNSMKQDWDPKDLPKKKDWRFYVTQKGKTVRAEMDALEYLLTKDKMVGRRAITSLIDTLTTSNWPHIQDIARASGRMMVTGAIVYDWCYDLLEEEEKQIFIKSFVRLAKTLECGYPPVKQNPITGHSSEWMIHRDLLSAAIAIYDEFPEMYELAAGRFFKDHLPVRNWIYDGHAYHQGSSYDNVRFTCDLFPLWMFDRMGAGNIYNPQQQYVIYNFIYKRRPDGPVLPSGDTNPTRGTKYLSLQAMLAAGYYKDPYINYEFRRNPAKIDSRSLLFDLLWRDTKLGVKKPNDLPLTKYFGKPFGWMIARTDWGKNAAIAEMKINEYQFNNHQHMDAGAFQIYYKGPLSIDSGAYTGSSGGYNSPHNKNYFKRTIAHNSLLIFDPAEEFKTINYGGKDKTPEAVNDGGQEMKGDNWGPPQSFDDLLQNFKSGKTLAHAIGSDKQKPDFSYLKGDITQAYSNKVEEVKRSFVFLNLKDEKTPAALIVFDKVVAKNPDFKKTWLLHSIEEPMVTNIATTIKRTKNGDTGKLINTTLLPEVKDLDIVKIGGPGKEFWVGNENFENKATSRPDVANERGSWRVEISPKKSQKENYFLNVMQITDTSNKKNLEVAKKINDTTIEVHIADRIVLFSKTMANIETNFSLRIPSKKTSKILITDLSPGKWSVKKGTKIILSEINVTKENGTLHFNGEKGKYTIVKN